MNDISADQPDTALKPDDPLTALQGRLERAETALRSVGLLDTAKVSGKAPRPVSLYALREMAIAGFRNNEIAAHFGLTRGEFSAFLKENKRAATLLHFGRAQFQAKIEQQLHQNALLFGHKPSLLAIARKMGLCEPIVQDYPI